MSLVVSSERRGGAAVVTLGGDFDLYTCAEARSVVEGVLEEGADDLFLDLTAVTFLDSSGLGTLVGLQKGANRAHTRMALCGLRPQLHKIIDVTHLRDAFTILPELPAPGPSTGQAGDSGHPLHGVS